MHIKRIEIDGFKSYAQRQVVDRFDSEFNAITGLNGTGKSNILDSICFVLGITNLSCIRANQMNDLVFKQGQAGINKATVTITFDNTDKSCSPTGYSNLNEIIVRRQVIVNGKNSYTINGTAVTNSRMADFFRGIGLNVNNPHFLIMQGRITKVLNMKPHEILGMLEEAAGTKMYDAKRDIALATIKKKQAKVEEIDKALAEDILPTVERLKQDRQNYMEYLKTDRDIANLERKLNAFVYYQSKIEQKQCLEDEQKKVTAIEETEEKLAENAAAIEKGDKEYAKLEEIKTANSSQEKNLLDTKMKELNKILAAAESDRDAVKDEQKKLGQSADRVKKTLAQDKKELDSKRKELASLEADKGGEEQRGVEARERVEKARAHLNAVMQGMTTDDQGKAVTVEAQINQAKSELTELSAKVKAAQTREKQLRPQLADRKKELANMSKAQTSEGEELDSLKAEQAKLNDKIGQTRFDEGRYGQLSQRKQHLVREKHVADQKLYETSSKSAINFNYNRQLLPRTFDESKVVGCIARHFTSVDPKFDQALEVAAGGQMWHVIVKESSVAKELIDTKGCLQNRNTFVPLDAIQWKGIEPHKTKIAKEIAAERGEECWSAIECISYDMEVDKAMRHVLGHIILCESKETASKITYDHRCKLRTVTLEGDSYLPGGSGQGGSRDKTHSYIKMANVLRKLESDVAQITDELMAIDAELSQLEPQRHQYEHMKQRLDEVEGRLQALETNLRHSPVQVLRDEVTEIEKELPDLEATIKEGQARAKELSEKVKSFEERKKNSKSFKEQEEKKAKKDLKDAEAALEKLGESFKDCREQLAARRAEVEALVEGIKQLEQTIITNEEDMVEAEKRLQEKQKAVDVAAASVGEGNEQMEVFRGRMREHDHEMKKLATSLAALRKESQKLTNLCEELQKQRTELKERAKQYQKMYHDVAKKHVWIKDVEECLGQPGTDFDFTSYSHERGKKDLDSVKERKEELGRKLNTQAMNVLGTAEENVMNLMKKKEQLELDKKTILSTIEQLDEKKKNEVLKAYQQVTKDFGNIFSTLLTGADAKLEPPAGKTALDGLEVKVAFNGKWKQGLTELSGGQRSLVALSLVLAMLKFKPAPLYILDEVDAALDLSHTQNIGAMIKKHFRNSQFIIVSLKEGMFNHANVLYRTRFQDGTSYVDRYVDGVRT